jgi:hypothetical protein
MYVPISTEQTVWVLHDSLFPLFLCCHGIFRQPLLRLVDRVKQTNVCAFLGPCKGSSRQIFLVYSSSCLLFPSYPSGNLLSTHFNHPTSLHTTGPEVEDKQCFCLMDT